MDDDISHTHGTVFYRLIEFVLFENLQTAYRFGIKEEM